MIGEIAALGRIQRTASVYAETDCQLLEIRWQGLRDLRKYDKQWRQNIDNTYRDMMLEAQLKTLPYFAHLDTVKLKAIAKEVLFETYGGYEWFRAYGDDGNNSFGTEAEPIVCKIGDYADGLLLIGAGFARISVPIGNSQRSIGYLGAGDQFGLYELYQSWKTGQEQVLQANLSALGFLHVLRIPTHVLHEWVGIRSTT